MRIPWLLVFLAAGQLHLFSAESSALFSLEKLAAVSANITTVRLAFTQTKHLALLDEPLIATGSMEIDRVHGAMRWEFTGHSILLLRDDRLRRFSANGHEESLPDEGGRAAMLAQMHGLMRGDWSALKELFAVTLAADGSPALICTPKNADLSRYLARLEIHFRDDLRGPSSLVLLTADDDRTDYAFGEPEIGIALPPERFLTP